MTQPAGRRERERETETETETERERERERKRGAAQIYFPPNGDFRERLESKGETKPFPLASPA